MFSSARYLLTKDDDYLWTALALPVAGCFFDLMDGKIARWRNSSSMLGQELDSLADLVSILYIYPPSFVKKLRRYHLEWPPPCSVSPSD